MPNIIPKFRAINRLSEGYKYSDNFDNLSDFFKWIEEFVIVDQVEKFTGLYDKNGKEIFEGDILRFFSRSFAESELSEKIEQITWDEERLCFWVGNDWNGFKPNKATDNNNFEVVVNIFENPNLLQELKDKIIEKQPKPDNDQEITEMPF